MEVLDAAEAGSRHGGPSFSLANRLRRAVWAVVWTLLAAWTPPPLHAWRVLLLRIYGARIGQNCRVYRNTWVWDPANLTLGNNVLIGPGANIYNQGHIAIGANSVVSQRSHLCASSHRISDRHFQLVLKPITIGANCWIAAEAFVGPGVTMHEGAVLGARGVLFDDAEAWTVYRGNPAAAISNRRYDSSDG
ncbi:MAG: putative colanic acid biosynthesis acetyltransferase [Novosphingobium sp.]|jgi:putative colanic acid biosynthesis acetyltransferase WcaF|nr:putative colanic acid biosynthesis acetyltransferase [Novosphingobium sp.]